MACHYFPLSYPDLSEVERFKIRFKTAVAHYPDGAVRRDAHSWLNAVEF